MYVCLCMYECMYACMCKSDGVSVRVFAYVCMCVFACVRACVCVLVCVPGVGRYVAYLSLCV